MSAIAGCNGGWRWRRRRCTRQSSTARMEPGGTPTADAGGSNRYSNCSRGFCCPRSRIMSAIAGCNGGWRWRRRRCTRRSSTRIMSAIAGCNGGWRWGRPRRCTQRSLTARLEPGSTPIADALGCLPAGSCRRWGGPKQQTQQKWLGRSHLRFPSWSCPGFRRFAESRRRVPKKSFIPSPLDLAAFARAPGVHMPRQAVESRVGRA
jgi:hypothetical protein